VSGDSAFARLVEPLAGLEDGWDGHGALAPRRSSMEAAAEFMRGLPRTGLPLPDVMASVAGGVLVEWHSATVDLLLNFEPGEPTTVYVRLGDVETEGDLADLIGLTSRSIEELASRP